jgi:hypothetical protein
MPALMQPITKLVPSMLFLKSALKSIRWSTENTLHSPFKDMFKMAKGRYFSNPSFGIHPDSLHHFSKSKDENMKNHSLSFKRNSIKPFIVAPKILSTFSDEWIKKLSAEERKSIKSYTWCSYRAINRILRREPPMTFDWLTTKEAQEHATNIHHALQKATIPIDLTVYRKSNLIFFKTLLDKDPFAIQGKILHENSFLSTSLNPNLKIYNANLQMKIHVPKGSKGALLGPLSLYEYEDEILFDKDQRMLIQYFEPRPKVSFMELYLKPSSNEKCTL